MPGELDGVEVQCTVCGIKRSLKTAMDEGWLPSWLDRAGQQRDQICPMCTEALGIEVGDDGEFVIFATRAALPVVEKR